MEERKPAGYSGTPLPKKLGLKEDSRFTTVDAPSGFVEGLGLAASVRVDDEPRELRSYDVMVAFVPVRAALDGLVERLEPYLTWAGGLWLAWPKRTSPLATDIGEADIRAAGLAAGLVDNKICAVDHDWSGLRFVHRKEDRPG